MDRSTDVHVYVRIYHHMGIYMCTYVQENLTVQWADTLVASSVCRAWS